LCVALNDDFSSGLDTLQDGADIFGQVTFAYM
jgi:hypothetical protein